MMNVTARVRLVRTWAGALGALVVCGLLIPSQAQAGCSRYVRHGAAMGDTAGLLDPAVGLLALTLPDVGTPSEGPRRPAPCSGPSCSGRTDAPTPPSVSTTRFVEPWACLAESWKRSDQDATPLDLLSRQLRPIHRGEPHPRPPRSTSPLAPSSV